jgi:hypothetical protein
MKKMMIKNMGEVINMDMAYLKLVLLVGGFAIIIYAMSLANQSMISLGIGLVVGVAASIGIDLPILQAQINKKG